MEAPWKDQLALLDLQELDSKIAKLQFRLKKMPQLAQLAELKEKTGYWTLRKLSSRRCKPIRRGNYGSRK